MNCWLIFHEWEKQKIGHQRSTRRTGTPCRPGRPLIIDSPEKIRLRCKNCNKTREFKVTSDEDKILYSYSAKEKTYRFDNYTTEQKAAWLAKKIKKRE